MLKFETLIVVLNVVSLLLAVVMPDVAAILHLSILTRRLGEDKNSIPTHLWGIIAYYGRVYTG